MTLPVTTEEHLDLRQKKRVGQRILEAFAINIYMMWLMGENDPCDDCSHWVRHD